ncbi:hypothetical protein [Draconibacterium sp.]|uniref:hypothetical protein n=1 Tax=Draconibacterium sp. TaxID=1965318 RepID=UPI0035665197
MTRASTKQKEKKVLSEFHRLLRSGKDYSANYMYEEAGKSCFLAAKSAGDIVRKHYQEKITDEMQAFVNNLGDMPHDVKVNLFAERFSLCVRESRLIIRYIRRNSIVDNLK